MKHTALYENHRNLGGRLIDFGGWELPVQYSGVLEEHLACRSKAGLFDVSHMGEVHVEGPEAEAYLNFLVTNNVAKLSEGQALYTAMCNASGGIVDDLVIYKRSPSPASKTTNRYLVVVNASNTEKDFAHMLEVRQVFFGQRQKTSTDDLLTLANVSDQYTQIALQGPEAAAILKQITKDPVSELKTYWFCEGHVLGDIPAVLARTGYTGEDGFEIYVPWHTGPKVWEALLEAGTPRGLKPCGLGARDTLRLEMKYPLYGHELSDLTNPLEAGLGWVTKLDKGDFFGKQPVVEAKEAGLTRSLVGLMTLERGIPRQGYALYNELGTERIGEITSGTQSPSLGKAIGIGYIHSSYKEIGTKIRIDIRGNKVLAEVVKTPFYKKIP